MGRKTSKYAEKVGNTIPQLVTKSANQDKLVKAINHSPISLALGPAGCGKTYVAAAMAAKAYTEGRVERIVISRANVPTGRSLGHFPGTIQDKLTPWIMPTLEVLRHFLGTSYQYCVDTEVIQLQPLETIRGRSFDNSFIIVDEAQNLVQDEMISITTRVGENSKLLLLGDPFQNDVKGLDGLTWFDQIIKKYHLDIPVVHFNLDDIVRSKIVKDILVALYKEFNVKN
jgi:phosphate starvation-inducible PhoH-like protein